MTGPTRWCQLLKCGDVHGWNVTPEVLALICKSFTDPVPVTIPEHGRSPLQIPPCIALVRELRFAMGELWGKVEFSPEDGLDRARRFLAFSVTVTIDARDALGNPSPKLDAVTMSDFPHDCAGRLDMMVGDP